MAKFYFSLLFSGVGFAPGHLILPILLGVGRPAPVLSKNYFALVIVCQS
jgi:hypothetical protein